MRSHSASLDLYRHHLSPLGHHRWRRRSFLPSAVCISLSSSLFRCRLSSNYSLQLSGSDGRKYGCILLRSLVKVRAGDEDSFGISALDDWDNDGTAGFMLSSSEGEDSDGEILLNPVTDVDLPSINERLVQADEAITVTAHRFAMLGKYRKKRRVRYGVQNNIFLIIFLSMLLLFVDWCAWRIVRLPLAPFYLTRPFFMSAILASCAGYICIPVLESLKIYQIFRAEGPARHSSKKRTPTMGGLFFIPIGVAVSKVVAGFSSIEVSGAVIVTLAFAAVGILDDIISFFRNHNYGLSPWIKILLQVAVATWFSFWLDTTNISSPYGMKMLIPLPGHLGLVYLGKYYLFLTSFCFVSMGNGVNLTDGLDGLAGGTAAVAFIGMSIAVLPICHDIALFGASMAGACVGFLLHNRYKASVFMGDTGSLALGGALAAMAACTGMFLPLFISSGIFVLEVLSVIMQVSYFKTTKRIQGFGRRLFRMAPFHHHLELCGIKEPIIVAGAYVVSCILAVIAGYVGLISV